MSDKEYCSVKQAAELLDVHEETIRRLLRDGTLAGKKTFTRQWRVDWARLVEVSQNYRATEHEQG